MRSMQQQCSSKSMTSILMKLPKGPLRHDIPSGGIKSRQSEQALHCGVFDEGQTLHDI